MAISDWPEAERPRERLLRQGAAALSDAELLAIFLRVGMRGKSAVDLARDLLAAFDGDLARLANAPPQELEKLPGIGHAKAVQLVASLELARRALAAPLSQTDILASPQAVRDWLRMRLGHLPHEVFVALWLDNQHRLISSEEVFRGTLATTSVYPREILKSALAHNAAAVIFAHNHPSGHQEASQADLELTKHLRQALALVDVRMLDHFIVTAGAQPLSLAEKGFV